MPLAPTIAHSQLWATRQMQSLPPISTLARLEIQSTHLITLCASITSTFWDANLTKADLPSGAIRCWSVVVMWVVLNGEVSMFQQPIFCQSSFSRQADWSTDYTGRVTTGGRSLPSSCLTLRQWPTTWW